MIQDLLKSFSGVFLTDDAKEGKERWSLLKKFPTVKKVFILDKGITTMSVLSLARIEIDS